MLSSGGFKVSRSLIYFVYFYASERLYMWILSMLSTIYRRAYLFPSMFLAPLSKSVGYSCVVCLSLFFWVLYSVPLTTHIFVQTGITIYLVLFFLLGYLGFLMYLYKFSFFIDVKNVIGIFDEAFPASIEYSCDYCTWPNMSHVRVTKLVQSD